MKNKNKKGQIFSIDAGISLISFIMVFIVVIAIYNLYTTRLNDNVLSTDLQLSAFTMSNALINTKGEPINWNNNLNNVTVMGLAKHKGLIDKDKLDGFLAMDYNLSKEIFNVEKFDYYFRVYDSSGEFLNNSGVNMSDEILEAVSVNRYVLVDNQTRQLQLILYRS